MMPVWQTVPVGVQAPPGLQVISSSFGLQKYWISAEPSVGETPPIERGFSVAVSWT